MKRIFLLLVLITGIACSMHAQQHLSSSAYLLKMQKPNSGNILLLIQTDGSVSPETFNNMGYHVNSVAGDVWSVSVPLDKIEVFGKIKSIRNVQFASSAKQMMDYFSRVLARVEEVYAGTNLPRAYKGKDIVIGVIDMGFDYTHPSFFDNEGHTRIKRVWEQHKDGKAPDGFSYGRELVSETEIINAAFDRDDQSHGTSVAGVAAGSQVKLKNRGMAPEADLVFVSIHSGGDHFKNSATEAPARILDAINYIFRYAQNEGKPAVINLSWGSHVGPHDGTTLLDKGIENLMGPGKVVVISAGNEGTSALHVGVVLAKDSYYVCPSFMSHQYTDMFNRGISEKNICDFWGSANTSFSMKIQMRNLTGTLIKESAYLSSASDQVHDSFLVNGTDTVYYHITCKASDPNNKRPEILVMYDNKAFINYRVTFGVTSERTTLHGWSCGYDWKYGYGMFLNKVHETVLPRALMGSSDFSIGEAGANAKGVITTGSYIGNTNWFNHAGTAVDLSLEEGYRDFGSSYGPSSDGSIKPDIMASASVISSPTAVYTPFYISDTFTGDSLLFNNKIYKYEFSFGTSIASAVVAGAAALMLEINPVLTTQRIKQIITETAINDAFTGNVKQKPTVEWGYGKLNTYDAMKKTLATVGIKEADAGIFEIYPNPFADHLTLSMLETGSGKVDIRLFDLQGRMIYSTVKDNTVQITVETATIPAGAYFMQVSCNGNTGMRKVICTK